MNELLILALVLIAVVAGLRAAYHWGRASAFEEVADYLERRGL